MTLAIAVSGLTILINAFFVTAEFSSVSARRFRIARLADGGNATARALQSILDSPTKLDAYIAACQVGITAASLLLGFYGQRQLTSRVGATLLAHGLDARASFLLGPVVVLALLTVGQIVVGELVPKAVALRSPERIALVTSAPMRLIERLFAPFIWLLNGTAGLILRALGLHGAPHAHLHSPEEIEMLIDEATRAGRVDASQRQLLANAFDLSGLVARQVMIPRPRLQLAPVDTPTDVLLARLAASPFSRIPVYRHTPDTIVGIVHLKDLFRLARQGEQDVSSVVRPVPMVPEGMPAAGLWQLLNQASTYLAVVLDEQGGTAGIVTQEDMLEEIIGEVQDEFDREETPIVWRGGEALVRGDVLVSDVNDAVSVALPIDRADTIGGLVLDELGRMASVGDRIEVAGVEIRVLNVKRHWVARVAVHPAGGR